MYTETQRIQTLEWKRKNKERVQGYTKKYKSKYPWAWTMVGARQRCTNKNHPRYNRYGGRGILFLLSKEDIKFLWKRDKAALMKVPSIDRINNDGHYELNNCRFIERTENSIKDKIVSVEGFKGDKVFKYSSLTEASIKHNVSMGNIWSCLNGRRKNCGGIAWKYARKDIQPCQQ